MASDTREAVALARHAEESVADAVVAVSRFYWKVGEEALFKHFATISESLDILSLIYNFPAPTGIDLSSGFVGRPAGECPNVVGIKETVTEYMHSVGGIREVKPVRQDFSVFVGFEDQILPAILAGGDGAIKADMSALGAPVSPAVRGPALQASDGASENIRAILQGSRSFRVTATGLVRK